MDVAQISSPNIHQAYYTNSAHTGIGLTFMQPETRFIIPADTNVAGIVASIKDYFFLNDTAEVVQSISTERNRIFLTLKNPTAARRLNYLSDKNYNGSAMTYEGPWFENTRGIGAFSFYCFPIVDSALQGVSKNKTSDIAMQVFLTLRMEGARCNIICYKI